MASRVFTIFVVSLAIVVLQYHAVVFWMIHAGSLGWMWSIGIESAAIWLWWRPNRLARMMGVLASVLSLAGPLYQVSSPLLQSIEQAEAIENARLVRIEVLRGTLRSEEESLRRYQELADRRIGWSGRIDKTQERIDYAKKKLNALTADRPKDGHYMGSLVIGMEAVALVLLQIVLVLAVRALSVAKMPMAVSIDPSETATINVVKSDKPMEVESEELTVPVQLKRHLEKSGESISAWARRNGLNSD